MAMMMGVPTMPVMVRMPNLDHNLRACRGYQRHKEQKGENT
jgi:hypothetical protein